ncbi:histidine kinase, partial [Acinetobacter baumannii]
MSTQLIAHLKKKCEADDNVKILLSQWEFDQKLVGKALENIGGFYPHFSNHNASHSQQILVNIERILGKDIDLLSATDTWLILEAAYWHDVGMLVDAKSAKDVHDNEDFKFMVKTIALDKGHDLHKFCLTYLDADWTGAIGSEDHPFDGVEKYRQLIAEWFRRNHDRRIGGLVEDPFKFLNITSPRTELLPKRIYRYLGQICMSHGMNFVDVLEKLPFKQTGLGTEDCHPRFIGCLLRLGDLFDLDDNRFCPVMAKHVGHQPSLSKVHEDKHLSLREFQLDKRTVKLVAECPNEMAYVETQNWFGWIREEFQNQMSQWNLIVPNEKFSALPTIEQLDVRMEIKNKEGVKIEKVLLDNKPMKFSVDEGKVIELIQGANLYSNEISIIRELFQNAVDATLLRIWVDKNKLNWEKINPFHDDFKAVLKDYPIEIDLEKVNEDNGVSYWILKIIDHGIGISINDLKYMQKIAGSSKNIEKKKILDKMPLWMKPSGEFGIGLHSAFLLMDGLDDEYKKIEIISKSYFSNETLEIVINSPLSSKKGYCFISKRNNLDREVGTTINISIKSEKFFNHKNRALKLEKNNFIFNKNFVDYAWRKSFLDSINNEVLNNSLFSNKDMLWDKEKGIGYKFYFNETKSSLDICYKGQQAIARNLHEFETYGLGGVLDYYNISAKDCLNINRDVWKEKFNLKIKDDLLELLKIYLDNNKSPSISMIKNMLSKEVRKKINADLDELWLDYKFEFKNLNRRLKLGKLFDNNHFYIFDEDIKYFFDLEEDLVGQNVYVVYNRGGNIFRKLFSLDFSIFKNYKIYSLISFDNDDEIFITGFFLSKNGEKPLDEVDGFSLVWQEVSLHDYDFDINNINQNLLS